jgi:hypothetical protein
MIDQDAAHHFCCHSEEVRPVCPRDSLVDKPQVGFMDESGSLQRVIGAFAVEVAISEAAKFVVNERKQLVQRFLIAVA